MMNKHALGSLTAVVLGLVLVLVSTQLFAVSIGSLWVLIGIALFASGISAFLSVWISTIGDRIKHGWNFGGPRNAHLKLASIIKENQEFDDVIIVAYTANSAYRMLELFEQRNCYAKRIRVLLRSPSAVSSGLNEESRIPNNSLHINNRLNQLSAHGLGDLSRKNPGKERVGQVEIKFYYGEPVLRGVVLDGRNGFFSIYTRHRDPEIIDYSATNSSTLRLSRDGGYEEKILVDFLTWFNLVWEHGSKSTDKDIADKI